MIYVDNVEEWRRGIKGKVSRCIKKNKTGWGRTFCGKFDGQKNKR